MRCRAIGFLIVATSAICFAQDATPPLVTSHTDEPIRADDPRAIQAHTEIQALILGANERWNAHDIDGFMEGAWKSKDFVMLIDAQEIRGWAEALAAYKRGYSDPSTMGNVVCDRLETQLITPNVGLAVMRWTLYLKGGKVLGTSSIVVRKFADGWKVVSDHSTTLEP
jgi:ketosteroid isomerase-like protein